MQGEKLKTDPLLLRWLRRTALALTAVIPLAVWPGIPTPFSTPKVFLLAAWVTGALVLLIALRPTPFSVVPGRIQVLLFAWATTISLSALVGEYASPRPFVTALLPIACFLILAWLRPDPQRIVRALILASLCIAGVAVLQYLGLDPFSLVGWTSSEAGNLRMKVYATLGNPNFVAAFISSVLPLAWVSPGSVPGFRRTILGLASIVLLGGGLLATGSRAPLLGGLAIFGWVTVIWVAEKKGIPSATSRDGKKPGLACRARLPVSLLLVILVVVVVPILSPARSLGETLRGRLYIWSTVAAHIREVPLFGWGPGSFELKYAAWETARLRETVNARGASQFAGVQDHAHNDYLETLVEKGFPGLVLLLGTPVFIGLSQGRRNRSSLVRGAFAGIFVLMAIAVVDFPFHRPAESFVFWSLLAVVHIGCSTPSVDTHCNSRAVSTGLTEVSDE